MRLFPQVLVLVVLLCASTVLGQYEIVDLGTRGSTSPGPGPRAYAINELGQATGAGGLFYDPAVGDSYIPMSGWGINDSGDVAGTHDQPPIASVHYNAGNVVDIASLGLANDINNSGQVAGHYSTSVYDPYHAFFYDPSTGLTTDIGVFGLYYSDATAINNNGLVVGYARNGETTDWRAFSYTAAGGGVDLSSSLGNPSFSIAHAVNDSGLIVGRIGSGFTDCLPLVYDSQTNTYQTLGSLGINMSGAFGVNDLGHVVGYYSPIANPQESDIRPFYWDGQTMIDLNTWLPASSGWTMTYAYDINNSGWIVGCGIAPDGNQHAMLIRPVPEPSLLALLGLGIAGIVKRRGVK
ncbi:MAG: DUF3466 family protein [Sedimentisphaerales bacterium]|nr:DUF3466 family protein [Sedimentisphaerales bacterium]